MVVNVVFLTFRKKLATIQKNNEDVSQKAQKKRDKNSKG